MTWTDSNTIDMFLVCSAVPPDESSCPSARRWAAKQKMVESQAAISPRFFSAAVGWASKAGSRARQWQIASRTLSSRRRGMDRFGAGHEPDLLVLLLRIRALVCPCAARAAPRLENLAWEKLTRLRRGRVADAHVQAACGQRHRRMSQACSLHPASAGAASPVARRRDRWMQTPLRARIARRDVLARRHPLAAGRRRPASAGP
jgi:hypothetical protein